jgi:hypothetical protein
MYTKLIHVLEYIRKCLQKGKISVLSGIMCFTKCNVGVDSGVNFGVTVYYGVLLQQMYTGEASNPNNN